MPTQSTTKAKSNGAKTAGSKAESKNQTRSVAETAVDFPVGVVLGATDRLTELVGPFTARSDAEKQLKTYRTQLRRSLKRTERRGASARRKATTEARKTRKRVERVARRRTQSLVDQVGEQLSALR
jgi:hypothetical protein